MAGRTRPVPEGSVLSQPDCSVRSRAEWALLSSFEQVVAKLYTWTAPFARRQYKIGRNMLVAVGYMGHLFDYVVFGNLRCQTRFVFESLHAVVGLVRHTRNGGVAVMCSGFLLDSFLGRRGCLPSLPLTCERFLR